MNIIIFLILTTVGSFIWNTVLVYLGIIAGASWHKIVEYMNIYSLIAVFAFGILAVMAVIIFYKKRFSKMNKEINNGKSKEEDNFKYNPAVCFCNSINLHNHQICPSNHKVNK